MSLLNWLPTVSGNSTIMYKFWHKNQEIFLVCTHLPKRKLKKSPFVRGTKIIYKKIPNLIEIF